MNESGILLVDKPEGMTSHDVVDLIRNKFGFKKVGHAGTLDPIATGLLVMLIGNATRLSNTFLNDDKEYYTNIKLGQATDTGDAAGKVISEKSLSPHKDEVEKVLEKFLGPIQQLPPMFSAKKHKGKKLYEFARKGINIERKPVTVNIKELEMSGYDFPFLALRVVCSKGTYIRQLACDIGDALGTGAHVSALRRLSSGGFSVDKAVTVNELERMGLEELYGCLIEKKTDE